MLEKIPFTPRWLTLAEEGAGAGRGKKKAAPVLPVYFLRLGSIIERDQFEAELEGRFDAGQVHGFQLLEAAVSGVRALLGEEGSEIEELIQADFGGGEKLAPNEKAKLKEALEILARSWPEYAALVEREARRNAILPTLAFARWCDGWARVADRDSKAIDYERDDLGELPDHVLRRLDVLHLRAAGLEAYAVQYGRGHAKN